MNKIGIIILLTFLTIQAISQQTQKSTDWIIQKYDSITFQLPDKPQIDNQELIFSNYKIEKTRFKSKGNYIECVLSISKLDTLITPDFAYNYIKFYCEKVNADFQGIEDVEINEGEIISTNETFRKSIKYSFYGQIVILNIFLNSDYLIECVSSFKIGAENYNDYFLKNLKLSNNLIFK